MMRESTWARDAQRTGRIIFVVLTRELLRLSNCLALLQILLIAACGV